MLARYESFHFFFPVTLCFGARFKTAAPTVAGLGHSGGLCKGQGAVVVAAFRFFLKVAFFGFPLIIFIIFGRGKYCSFA